MEASGLSTHADAQSGHILQAESVQFKLDYFALLTDRNSATLMMYDGKDTLGGGSGVVSRCGVEGRLERINLGGIATSSTTSTSTFFSSSRHSVSIGSGHNHNLTFAIHTHHAQPCP